MGTHKYNIGDIVRLKTIEELSHEKGFNIAKTSEFWTSGNLYIPESMYKYLGNEYMIAENFCNGYDVPRFTLLNIDGSDGGVHEWMFDESLVSDLVPDTSDDWDDSVDNGIDLW